MNYIDIDINIILYSFCCFPDSDHICCCGLLYVSTVSLFLQEYVFFVNELAYIPYCAVSLGI